MRALLILSALTFAGCKSTRATAPGVIAPKADGLAAEVAKFASHSKERTDWILRFGEPSEEMEQGRILCWRLVQHQHGWRPCTFLWSIDFGERLPWRNAMRGLTATFSNSGQLQQFALTGEHGAVQP